MIGGLMLVDGRQEMVARAVHYWQEQAGLRLRRLYILDTGDSPIVIPRDDAITYWRDWPDNLGKLRNRIAARAVADGCKILMHVDSDDISMEGRADYQAAHLSGFSSTWHGWNDMAFWDDASREAWAFQGMPGGVLGSTLAYRAEWWRLNPFVNYEKGQSEYQHWFGRGETDRCNMYVRGLIHEGNTSPWYDRRIRNVADEWLRIDGSDEEIRRLFEEWRG